MHAVDKDRMTAQQLADFEYCIQISFVQLSPNQFRITRPHSSLTFRIYANCSTVHANANGAGFVLTEDHICSEQLLYEVARGNNLWTAHGIKPISHPRRLNNQPHNQ